MNIPQYVKDVLKCLNSCGYEAYMVGGCVRDCLMGNEPNDYDITTNATPEQMLLCFKDFKVIPTGIKHGTVTVVSDGENIEVTTYRIDGEYVDNRHPENVTFTKNLKDDLSRRDFTINAMAMDIDGNIADFYGGKKDLKKRIVKCVGNAETRFAEDGLRIMRCVRFASTQGYKTEAKTAAAIHDNVHLLQNISKERIASELSKLVCGKNAYDIMTEFQDVIYAVIADVNADNFKLLCTACDDLYVRLALCFDDGQRAYDALSDLKYDNFTKREVKNLIEAKVCAAWDKIELKKHLGKYGSESFARHVSYAKAMSDRDFSGLNSMFDSIISNHECYKISMLDIDGNDIIALGASGKQTGEILDKLLELVITEQLPNENNILIQKAKEIMLE